MKGHCVRTGQQRSGPGEGEPEQGPAAPARTARSGRGSLSVPACLFSGEAGSCLHFAAGRSGSLGHGVPEAEVFGGLG